LKGAFNFAVSWNDRAATDPGRLRSTDATAEPAELGSGITFFTGVEKIGLKMTREKRPMPVVVVDKD
jgi:uncharacterized protein (TIGR03435 family)